MVFLNELWEVLDSRDYMVSAIRSCGFVIIPSALDLGQTKDISRGDDSRWSFIRRKYAKNHVYEVIAGYD
jgi:hypothetical protein